MPARWAIVPFEEIESFLPKSGKIIDLGCGEGVLCVLLAISSKRRKVLGLDLNKKKIKLGKNIAQEISNLDFKTKDVTESLPKADAFVMSDFLHHIERKEHRPLINSINDSLKKGGVLVIKEIDLNDGLRSKISRFFDFLFYPMQKVYFSSSDELTNLLTENGMQVRIIKYKKWFPGSTTLIIARKR